MKQNSYALELRQTAELRGDLGLQIGTEKYLDRKYVYFYEVTSKACFYIKGQGKDTLNESMARILHQLQLW